MKSITASIRKLAMFIKMAAITREELKKTLNDVESILHDEKNFASAKGDPLMFSPEGIKKADAIATHMRWSPGKTLNVEAIINRLHKYIETAGKVGNAEMAKLNKELEKPANDWLSLNLKDMDFTGARRKMETAIDRVKAIMDQIGSSSSKHVSPEELEEMKQHGII
jgi:hypothetical protein